MVLKSQLRKGIGKVFRWAKQIIKGRSVEMIELSGAHIKFSIDGS